MSWLVALLRVVVGKTVEVPLGVALVVVVGLVLHLAAPDVWHAVGPWALLAGVAAVLGVAALRS